MNDIYEKINHYKIIIDKQHLFDDPLIQEIRNYFRVELTWSSCALEGNSLSIIDTKVLIEDKITPNAKPIKDMFLILGCASAVDYIFSIKKNKGITVADIIEIHKLLYFYFPISISKIGKNTYDKISEIIEWMHKNNQKYSNIIEFIAHLNVLLLDIHPFDTSSNGLIARLIINAVLIQNNYMPVVILPNLKHDYIKFLEQAHINDKPFINFLEERALESEKQIMYLLNLE